MQKGPMKTSAKSLQRFSLPFALLLFLSGNTLSWTPANQGADAAATVKAFYAFHFAHKFDYSRRGLLQRRKWLEATLYKALVAEISKPTKPDEVPDLDGDPFTNSQEYPNSFRLGNAKLEASKAEVQVVFVWSEKGKVIEEKSLEVELVKSNGLWKIANLIDKSNPDGDLLRFLQHKH
jgi:hypothetical protein